MHNCTFFKQIIKFYVVFRPESKNKGKFDVAFREVFEMKLSERGARLQQVHTRRIHTEDKAKVVAVIWGTDFM